jgi:hypothetical protein
MTTYDVIEKLKDMGLPEIGGYYYSFDYKLMVSVYHSQTEVRICINANNGKFYTPENAILCVKEYLMNVIDPLTNQYHWKVLGQKVKLSTEL